MLQHSGVSNQGSNPSLSSKQFNAFELKRLNNNNYFFTAIQEIKDIFGVFLFKNLAVGGFLHVPMI